MAHVAASNSTASERLGETSEVISLSSRSECRRRISYLTSQQSGASNEISRHEARLARRRGGLRVDRRAPSATVERAARRSASQGSFFVGGEKKSRRDACARPGVPRRRGEITVNQMYVQYQIPLKRRRACPGRHGARLLPEQQDLGDDARRAHGLERVLRAPAAARSTSPTRCRARAPASTPTAFGAVRAGGQPPPAQLPNMLSATPPDRLDGVPLRPELSAQPFPDRPVPGGERSTSSTSR